MNQETSRTRNIERVKNKLKSHWKHCSSPLSEARVHFAQDLGQMQMQTLGAWCGYQILNGIGPPAFIKPSWSRKSLCLCLCVCLRLCLFRCLCLFYDFYDFYDLREDIRDGCASKTDDEWRLENRRIFGKFPKGKGDHFQSNTKIILQILDL